MFIFARIHDADISYNNVKKLTQIQYEFFKADGSVLRNSPEIILEKDFQQYISTRLGSIEADIVVLKGQERVFETRVLSIIELERCLEKTGDNLFKNIVEIQGKTYMVKVIPVNFNNGESGKIVLLAPTVNDWMTTEKLLIFSGMTFVISFIITNIAIIFIFSKKS